MRLLEMANRIDLLDKQIEEAENELDRLRQEREEIAYAWEQKNNAIENQSR
jgi:prefoldin subunit 5